MHDDNGGGTGFKTSGKTHVIMMATVTITTVPARNIEPRINTSGICKKYPTSTKANPVLTAINNTIKPLTISVHCIDMIKRFKSLFFTRS